MRYSLRHLFAVFTLAVIAAAASAMLIRSTKQYSANHGGGHATWEYGEVGACSTIRGQDIPTVIFGNANSEFSAPGMDQLPFALVLTDEQGGLFDVTSLTKFRNGSTAGPTSTTTIHDGALKTVVTYSLLRNSSIKPFTFVESFDINGKEHDLSDGRLFLFDAQLNVEQHKIPKIDRKTLPRYFEGGVERFDALLDWWRKVSQSLPSSA